MRVSLAIAALAARSYAGLIGARHGARTHAGLHGVESRAHTVEKRSDAVYMPLNVVTSRATSSIEARDTALLSNLDPSDRAHMVFGQVGSDGGLNVAEMVLFADTDLPIVLMEAFEGLTSAVDCQGNDGQMSLTFGSAEAFSYALNSWSYIHEDAEQQFLLIANHDGCGPDGQRQAYRITDVDNDETNNVVYLTAVTAPWKEIAGNFDMRFGKASVSPPVARALRARGFGFITDGIDKLKETAGDVIDMVTEGTENVVDTITEETGDIVDEITEETGEIVDDITEGTENIVDDVTQGAGEVIGNIQDGGENVVDKIQEGGENVVEGIANIGDTDISESITIPVSLGKENEETLLFEDLTTLPPKLKVFCANCFVDAKFETTGSLKVQNFVPESLRLDVAPTDFRAAIELKAEVAQKNPALDFLTFEKTLFEVAIPGAGIVIPRLFTLGATAALIVQANAGASGKATFTFGARTSLPNGSKVSVDLVNPGNSGISGFGEATVEPVFDIDQISLTANVAAGPQVALTFGIEILENTGIEAALKFGTPTINLNVTGGFNENGFCGPDHPITSGIETVAGANFDMVLSVVAKASETEKIPLFLRKLVNIPIATFLDKCFPLPGITPDNEPVAATTVAAPQPTETVVGSVARAVARALKRGYA